MSSNKIFFLWLFLSLFVFSCNAPKDIKQATTDDGSRFMLKSEDLAQGAHHTQHTKIFGKYVSGYNYAVLQGIDRVQATAPDGGGYFIGIHATPTESPVGYPVRLLGHTLLDPPRKTSYCSGSSFSALIEALDIILKGQEAKLDSVHAEALRMQEPDGGRREDHVKFWGEWNADGFGSDFALVQYTKMGKVIKPVQARPGDFMNISWKSGIGHSVVFLGWYLDENGQKMVAYWSSQKSTNGFGDAVVPISRIKEVKVVRLTHPEHLFDFDVNAPIDTTIPGDAISW
jgi:hypothetical protein